MKSHKTNRYNGHIVHCDCRKRCADLEAACTASWTWLVDAARTDRRAQYALDAVEKVLGRKPESVSK